MFTLRDFTEKKNQLACPTKQQTVYITFQILVNFNLYTCSEDIRSCSYFRVKKINTVWKILCRLNIN